MNRSSWSKVKPHIYIRDNIIENTRISAIDETIIMTFKRVNKNKIHFILPKRYSQLPLRECQLYICLTPIFSVSCGD